MFPVQVVDSLASFLAAQAFQFRDDELPMEDDPPDARSWNVYQWAA